jgi:hypothetical protein
MPPVPEPGRAAGDYCRAVAAISWWRGGLAGLRPQRQKGVLRMITPVPVQIVGAPVACAAGVKDTWRTIAKMARDQLHRHFGEAVQVDYFDLFDPACPPLPSEVQLPVVFIAGRLFSSGGKISVPAIGRAVESTLRSITAITPKEKLDPPV